MEKELRKIKKLESRLWFHEKMGNEGMAGTLKDRIKKLKKNG